MDKTSCVDIAGAAIKKMQMQQAYIIKVVVNIYMNKVLIIFLNIKLLNITISNNFHFWTLVLGKYPAVAYIRQPECLFSYFACKLAVEKSPFFDKSDFNRETNTSLFCCPALIIQVFQSLKH